MKLNKTEFFKSEFGSELKRTITAWDQALEEQRNHDYDSGEFEKGMKSALRCQVQWEVYQMAIKHFYGMKYHFTRTDEYYGLCTEDESDWLMKVDREQMQFHQYHASAEDIKEAMRRTREMQRIAREYKSDIPDQSETNAMGLVLGRAAELGKITP